MKNFKDISCATSQQKRELAANLDIIDGDPQEIISLSCNLEQAHSVSENILRSNCQSLPVNKGGSSANLAYRSTQAKTKLRLACSEILVTFADQNQEKTKSCPRHHRWQVSIEVSPPSPPDVFWWWFSALLWVDKRCSGCSPSAAIFWYSWVIPRDESNYFSCLKSVFIIPRLFTLPVVKSMKSYHLLHWYIETLLIAVSY